MNAIPIPALLIGHLAADARRLQDLLDTRSRPESNRHVFQVVHADGLTEALASPPDRAPAVVLLDLSAPHMSGSIALAAIQTRWPPFPGRSTNRLGSRLTRR